MKWNWDFLRNTRTEIDNRFRRPAPAGKQITVNGHAHEIQGAHLSDMDVAGRIRMLMRGQLDHESVCTLARDRVVYLADRLGEIESITAEQIGRAILEVENRYIAPNFPAGHKLRTFEELREIEKRLHVDYGKAVLELITGAPPPDDDEEERCIACAVPFAEGDDVLDDVNGGTLHFACCGPEREGFVGADGEPLKDGEPIPTPYKWTTDIA